MTTEIKLPELKENVDTVEVNELLVSEGDEVSEDQPLIEVQADKAALDVPAPTAGILKEFRVSAGDEIKVGDIFCIIESSEGGSSNKLKEEKKEEKEEKKEEPPKQEKEEPVEVEEQKEESPPQPQSEPDNGEAVTAGPATRRLAREFGVDLERVAGSGRKGRITEEDVRAYVKQLASGVSSSGEPVPQPTLPNFESFGAIERQKLTKVRQLTAQQMARAWSLIPHVTQHDEADITELEAFRKSQKAKGGPRLTVTAFALKAACIALKQYPQFNASLDLANNELILKQYYHLGVAVDTDKGLLVPVIRDVDQKSVEALANELTEMAEDARNGKASMEGGTFTITNLGGIGGIGFTPIVNHPEVAILGISRGRWQPRINDDEIEERLMLPLSLSYDHRVIDGADAARFTRLIAEMLENPWMMVLKG